MEKDSGPSKRQTIQKHEKRVKNGDFGQKTAILSQKMIKNRQNRHRNQKSDSYTPELLNSLFNYLGGGAFWGIAGVPLGKTTTWSFFRPHFRA